MEWDAFARDAVGGPQVRVAAGIVANIATRQLSGQSKVRRMARGSLKETQHFLRRAYKRKLLSDNQVKKISPPVDNLAPVVNEYLKSRGRVQNSAWA